MRAQHRQHLQEPEIDEVLPPEERRLQTRLHALELGAIFIEETAETRRVVRREGSDLLLHALDVGGCAEFAAVSKNDAVLRIEANHLHLGTQRSAGRGEDFLEHARVEKKRRTKVELEAVRFDRRRPAADEWQPLEKFHFD